MKRHPLKKHLFEICIVLAVLVVIASYSIPQFLRAQNLNHSSSFPDPEFLTIIQKYMGSEPSERFTFEDTKTKTEQLNIQSVHLTQRGMPYFIVSINQLPSEEDIIIIESLDGIEHFPNISGIIVRGAIVKHIELKSHPNMKQLNLSYCGLETLDISGAPNLEELNISGNSLKHLDLSNNPNLKTLSVMNCDLDELILSHQSKLEDLSCLDNNLTTLDLSSCIQLNNLFANDNRLTKVIFPQSNTLQWINLANNELETLPEVTLSNKWKIFDLDQNQMDCEDLPALKQFETEWIPKGDFASQFVYHRQKNVDLEECE